MKFVDTFVTLLKKQKPTYSQKKKIATRNLKEMGAYVLDFIE